MRLLTRVSVKCGVAVFSTSRLLAYLIVLTKMIGWFTKMWGRQKAKCRKLKA